MFTWREKRLLQSDNLEEFLQSVLLRTRRVFISLLILFQAGGAFLLSVDNNVLTNYTYFVVGIPIIAAYSRFCGRLELLHSLCRRGQRIEDCPSPESGTSPAGAAT
ncbi:MAG: hypothetical protein KDA89_22965 [Planctomycetaceae bacterium]|nr:hypothetical protein [Planctomycetaceae bacterium]